MTLLHCEITLAPTGPPSKDVVVESNIDFEIPPQIGHVIRYGKAAWATAPIVGVEHGQFTTVVRCYSDLRDDDVTEYLEQAKADGWGIKST